MPLNKATLYFEVLFQPEHSPHVQHVGGFYSRGGGESDMMLTGDTTTYHLGVAGLV